jgi:hypothetical protein
MFNAQVPFYIYSTIVAFNQGAQRAEHFLSNHKFKKGKWINWRKSWPPSTLHLFPHM